MKSSHNGENRIILWRNTIQLFYEDRKKGIVGPFKKSGYTLYFIESSFQNKKTENFQTPDICSCNFDLKRWLVLELSINDKSKSDELKSYKELEPRDVSTYNLPKVEHTPDVICSRLKKVDDGESCTIIVSEIFEVINEQYIEDLNLRKNLSNFNGTSLNQLPSIPITLVPEMKRQEIPEGLSGIVISLFDPNSNGLSATEMCEQGMERIFTITSHLKKDTLIHMIKDVMNDLIKGDLKEYLELKDGEYRVTEKYKKHPQTLTKISSIIENWVHPERITFYHFDDEFKIYD